MTEGTLYICGTPIGNLADITLRALDTLGEVDLIAAEDTRRTSKLLNYYDLDTQLTSYHEHNADTKKQKLYNKLQTGNDIALVSDAGMPGVSDPGYKLVNLLREEEMSIKVIPGPTAMTSGLVTSGLATDRFAFEGFLPRKKQKRQQYLRQLTGEERTIICYEAPHRLQKTLQDIWEILGDRQVAVCRELTKKFEEVLTSPVSELVTYYQTNKPQGEIVLVLEGGVSNSSQEEWKDLSILEHVKTEMEEGLTKKEAIKEVAQVRDLPKSEVYQIATKIRVNR
ncbi:16S rRNA (cytidine(1402)-2'-O)-methyltransferase [Halanaerobaculum tunisiense]